MNSWLTSFAISVMLLTCGCSSHYFGYTEQQWQQLSAEEQENARLEYEDILKLKQDQQHADKIDARKQQIIDFGSGHESKF